LDNVDGRLVEDKSFRTEQVPSISTINRIIRLSDTIDQHATTNVNTEQSVWNIDLFLAHFTIFTTN